MDLQSGPIFHKAITVFDLKATRDFYGDTLGCPTARRGRDSHSCDFDLFGNHLVCHLVAGDEAMADKAFRQGANHLHHHFGLVLAWDAFDALVARIQERGVAFLVEPTRRYTGEPREEALAMLKDPSDHVIEFKAFRNIDHLFGRA